MPGFVCEVVFGPSREARLAGAGTGGNGDSRPGQSVPCGNDLSAAASRGGRFQPSRSIAGWVACRVPHRAGLRGAQYLRSEEHTSELQSLMRISYAVFCLKKKKKKNI